MNLPKTVFPFLLYFASKQWIKITIAIFASASWGIYSALFPYLLKQLINTLGSLQQTRLQCEHQGLLMIIEILGAWILAHLFHVVQGFVFRVDCCTRFRASIREALFHYVQTHSTSFFATHFSGTIANKISDIPNNCEMLLTTICVPFTTALVMSISIFVSMWAAHPIFAGLLVVWLVLHFMIVFFFSRKSNFPLQDHANCVTELSGRIVDVFTNIQNVKLFAREKEEVLAFRKLQEEEIKKSHYAHTQLEWTQVAFSINHTFLIAGMLLLLMQGWRYHWVSLGDFAQIMIQSFYLSGWIWFVSEQINDFIKKLATVNAALSLIEQPHEIIDRPKARSLSLTAGEICFKNITFSYSKTRPVFQNFSVTIAPGEKVGLVGHSGAGKTTFMNLLLRLYDLQEGAILIDGVSIAEVTQESLHKNIAVIPQEASLFHRTLLENIRYGRPDATEEEVIMVSKMAHCHEFIEQSDAKYHSLVGERGIRLSGGERQRIAIARALLKNAPILLLDEATSSLDSATEQKIQESLALVMKNRTTMVIAHRLSTLAAMDRILVFEHGKILEDGSIEELLKRNGYFASFWKKQHDASWRTETLQKEKSSVEKNLVRDGRFELPTPTVSV